VTWYEFLLFFHILTAALWVGGGAMMQMFALRAMRAQDAKRLADFTGDVSFIGSRFLTPVSLLVILAGVLMVVDADYLSFDMDWITIAFILFAITFLAGALFFGPESGRIAKLIESEGPSSPQVLARIQRLLALTRADLMVLFLIIFDMAVKPSWDDAWLWIAVGVFALLGAVLVRNGLNAKLPAASAG
jgi:uncharacterized membrane protein